MATRIAAIMATAGTQQKLLKSSCVCGELIGAHPSEIIFTSGATESVGLALKGFRRDRKSLSVITCSTEHEAVLEACDTIVPRCSFGGSLWPNSNGEPVGAAPIQGNSFACLDVCQQRNRHYSSRVSLPWVASMGRIPRFDSGEKPGFALKSTLPSRTGYQIKF